MDIKAYIDEFSEISELPRERQFALLDNAQKRAAKKSVWFRTGLYALFAPAFFPGLLIIAVYFFTAGSPWFYLAAVVVGLLVARVAVKEFESRCLHSALKEEIKGHSRHKAHAAKP